MVCRSRLLSVALSLSLLALPAASLAHEGHEHPEQGQAAGPPAGDPNASSQPQDDEARGADAAAERAAKRKKLAEEDASKAKAATPASPVPRSDSGPH